MASAAYFAPAFPYTLATDSLLSPSHETIRKRKRRPAFSEDDSSGQETQGLPSDGGLEALSSVAVGPRNLGQDIAVQFEISGHPKGRALPGSNFPHAHRQRPISSTQSTVNRGLADLRPPLYVGTASERHAITGVVGLRQQHLLAITAILHKCVLEGDFNRAGRAWGMLLRAEHNGQSLDLRSNDRWGLGAEIILRREARLAHIRDESERTFQPQETNGQHRTPSNLFDLKRFEHARDYYERIVLQYPYRKAFPNTLGPQEFYIAMFSLWIYSVENERLLAQAHIEQGAADGTQVHTREFDQDSPGSMSGTERHPHRLRASVRRNALRRADDIAARLRELIMSPPYSDNHRYPELHDMVEKWVSHLSEGLHRSGKNDDEGNTSSGGSVGSNGRE